MNEWAIGMVIAVGFVMAGLVGIFGNDEPDPCQTYNEMRAIYQESNGEYGWPQYQPEKDEECGYES